MYLPVGKKKVIKSSEPSAILMPIPQSQSYFQSTAIPIPTPVAISQLPIMPQQQPIPSYSHLIPFHPIVAPSARQDKRCKLQVATIEDRSPSIAVCIQHWRQPVYKKVEKKKPRSGYWGGWWKVSEGYTSQYAQLQDGCCQSSPAPMPNCLASWSETFSGRAQMAFDGKKSASGWRYRYRYLLALHMAHNSICNAYQAPLCHAIGDNCIIRLQMPNIALIALSSHFSPVFANWNVFSWELLVVGKAFS